MTNEDKPLVTFALFAYNHESYIRKAVEAALAQDYPNLEIIISDDCSQDRTFEIIKGITGNYSGPHRVSVRQTTSNSGVANHVTQIFNIAQGELVVVAAGDDTSLPERTSALVRAWVNEGRQEGALHSNCRIIDLDGNWTGRFRCGKAADADCATLEYFVRNQFHAIIHGATAAYTPGLFRSFGPLTSAFEDNALTFRVLLTGKLIYVDQFLVDYRAGGISRGLRRSEPVRAAAWIKAIIANIQCHRLDYQVYCKATNTRPDEAIIGTLERLEHRYTLAQGVASPRLIQNLRALMAIPINGTFRDRLYVAATFFGLRS